MGIFFGLKKFALIRCFTTTSSKAFTQPSQVRSCFAKAYGMIYISHNCLNKITFILIDLYIKEYYNTHYVKYI